MAQGRDIRLPTQGRDINLPNETIYDRIAAEARQYDQIAEQARTPPAPPAKLPRGVGPGTDESAGQRVEGSALGRIYEGAGRGGAPTPTGIWENLRSMWNLATKPVQEGYEDVKQGNVGKGLLKMFVGPEKLADDPAVQVAQHAVIDPLSKFGDPETRRAFASETSKFLGGGGLPGASPTDPIRALEVVPGLGPSYTQAREEIDKGNIAGGSAQALATSWMPFFKVPEAVTNSITKLAPSNLARKFADAALHDPDASPAQRIARTTSALEHDLLPWGINAGQRKAGQLTSEAYERAINETGWVVDPETGQWVQPRLDPNTLFGGPERTGGPAVQAVMNEVTPTVRATTEQIPYIQEQTARLAQDPRLVGTPITNAYGKTIGPTPGFRPLEEDVLRHAEMLNDDAVASNATNAQTMARNAAAQDFRSAVERASSPKAGPYFRTIESIEPGRVGLQRAIQAGAPVGSSYRALLRSVGYATPAGFLQRFSNQLPNVPGAAVAQGAKTSMEAAVRAAILARLLGGG